MGQSGSDWWYSDSGQADGQGREPAQRGGHPPTEAAAPVPQGYDHAEHLRRIHGAQAGAYRLRDTEARFSPQPPAYGQPGHRHAPPPRKSWPAAHKGATAVLSLCAVAVATAAVLALSPSRPATATAGAAAGTAGSRAAGSSPASPAQGGQPGTTAAGPAGPVAGVTVTATGKAGAGKTVRTVITVTAAPGAPAAASPASASPAPDTGASSQASGGGTGTAPVVNGTSPVVVVTTAHTTAVGPTPPTPPTPVITPVPATCSVTGDVPVVQATLISAVAESFDVSEYGTAGALLAQVVIPVPAPPAGGGTVTGDGAANTSLVSCEVTGVAEAGN